MSDGTYQNMITALHRSISYKFISRLLTFFSILHMHQNFTIAKYPNLSLRLYIRYMRSCDKYKYFNLICFVNYFSLHIVCENINILR